MSIIEIGPSIRTLISPSLHTNHVRGGMRECQIWWLETLQLNSFVPRVQTRWYNWWWKMHHILLENGNHWSESESSSISSTNTVLSGAAGCCCCISFYIHSENSLEQAVHLWHFLCCCLFIILGSDYWIPPVKCTRFNVETNKNQIKAWNHLLEIRSVWVVTMQQCYNVWQTITIIMYGSGVLWRYSAQFLWSIIDLVRCVSISTFTPVCPEVSSNTP